MSDLDSLIDEERALYTAWRDQADAEDAEHRRTLAAKKAWQNAKSALDLARGVTGHRESQDATPRLSMTSARRARILAAHDHACAYPDCQEAVGLEIDHVIPLEIGGRDLDENLQPLCGAHHKAKTRLDAKMIARARRLRKAPTAERKPSRIKSRGFGLSRAFTAGRNAPTKRISP
jgi:5-methylcytosine-specific restriction endonuclease McrA